MHVGCNTFVSIPIQGNMWCSLCTLGIVKAIISCLALKRNPHTYIHVTNIDFIKTNPQHLYLVTTRVHNNIYGGECPTPKHSMYKITVISSLLIIFTPLQYFF